jgi:hypothetical protein
MSLVGALNKIGAAYKKSAPFHSAVDEALASLARQKGTGPEFLRELSKTPGVKPAELTHRKLDKILQAQGKITKDDVLKLARENPPAGLHENVSQDLTDKQLTKAADEIAQDFGYDDYYSLPRDLQRQADDKLEAMGSKYGQYQFPGGENYREIKMKLPSFTKEDSDRMMELEAYKRRASYPEQWGKMTGEDQELKDLMNRKAALSDPYLSSHWKDEPNVLAHMRVSDRTGPEGQKVLHVEEIQSDWHQEGRNKGYASEEKPIRMAGEVVPLDDGTYGVKWQDGSMDSLGWGKSHAERLAQQGKLTGVVPDAPFKKNWHELAMKRLLNYAADNGYDSIAITPGAEQAKRYDLSKHVDELAYWRDGDRIGLSAVGPRGTVFDQEYFSPTDLPNVVGKELAEKILNGKGAAKSITGFPEEPGVSFLSQEGLQVGGEGMKGFYDQMLPAYLNQFGKKYGTQVELHGHQVELKPKSSQPTYNFNGEQSGEVVYPEEVVKLHQFPITPEMREEIANKGFPLYQKGGPVDIEQEYKFKKFRK